MKLPILALILAAAPASTHAAILYSGLQNIGITNSFTSVYVDVDAVSSGLTQATGWDLDAFFGGEAFGNSINFQPARQSVAVNSAILRLNIGALVDSSRNYWNAEAGSSTHIGAAPNQFASGAEGYLGFSLIDNSNTGPYYGWMRVNFSNTGTIIDWAYENTPGSAITVGAIPEPSALALLGLGGTLCAFRRRRAA